jgi:hypothetical protein
MASQFCVSLLLILLSGDVELNPGPPKRIPGAPSGPAKPAPSKEEQLDMLEAKVNKILIFCFFCIRKYNKNAFVLFAAYRLAQKLKFSS